MRVKLELVKTLLVSRKGKLRKLSDIGTKKVKVDGILLYSSRCKKSQSSANVLSIEDQSSLKTLTTPRSKSFSDSSTISYIPITLKISMVKSTKSQGSDTISTLMVNDLPYFSSKDISVFDLNTRSIIGKEDIISNRIATHKKVGNGYIYNDSIVTIKDFYINHDESEKYIIRYGELFENVPGNSDLWPCIYLQHGDNSLLYPLGYLIN